LNDTVYYFYELVNNNWEAMGSFTEPSTTPNGGMSFSTINDAWNTMVLYGFSNSSILIYKLSEEGIWDLSSQLPFNALRADINFSGDILTFSTTEELANGIVLTYKFENNSWTQMGNLINAPSPSEFTEFGSDVRLSNDGYRIAIGSFAPDTIETPHPILSNTRSVHIYDYDLITNEWNSYLNTPLIYTLFQANSYYPEIAMSNDGDFVTVCNGDGYSSPNGQYGFTPYSSQLMTFNLSNNSFNLTSNSEINTRVYRNSYARFHLIEQQGTIMFVENKSYNWTNDNGSTQGTQTYLPAFKFINE
jgi:hypothetical protein